MNRVVCFLLVFLAFGACKRASKMNADDVKGSWKLMKIRTETNADGHHYNREDLDYPRAADVVYTLNDSGAYTYTVKGNDTIGGVKQEGKWRMIADTTSHVKVIELRPKGASPRAYNRYGGNKEKNDIYSVRFLNISSITANEMTIKETEGARQEMTSTYFFYERLKP